MSFLDDEEELDFTPSEQSKQEKADLPLPSEAMSNSALTGEVKQLKRQVQWLEEETNTKIGAVSNSLHEKLTLIDPKLTERSAYNPRSEIDTLKAELKQLQRDFQDYRETSERKARLQTQVLQILREELKPSPVQSAHAEVESAPTGSGQE